MNRINKG